MLALNAVGILHADRRKAPALGKALPFSLFLGVHVNRHSLRTPFASHTLTRGFLSSPQLRRLFHAQQLRPAPLAGSSRSSQSLSHLEVGWPPPGRESRVTGFSCASHIHSKIISGTFVLSDSRSTGSQTPEYKPIPIFCLHLCAGVHWPKQVT